MRTKARSRGSSDLTAAPKLSFALLCLRSTSANTSHAAARAAISSLDVLIVSRLLVVLGTGSMSQLRPRSQQCQSRAAWNGATGLGATRAGATSAPGRLTGLRILDVGGWDSYWTFDALERGTEEVLAIDDFSDNLDEGHNVSRPKWETFNLCRDALGHSEERCPRKETNILISRRKMSAASMSCFFRHPLSPAPPVASSRQASHHWYGNYPWWKAPYATTTARIAA